MKVFYFKLKTLLELLTFLLLEYEKCQCNENNINIVYKNFDQIELNENVPIGHLVTDLKEELVRSDSAATYQIDNYHFNFEFLTDLTELRDKNIYKVNMKQNVFLLKKYFLLDVYTGTIYTSKTLDLENFCDLCQINEDGKACEIKIGVKATRYLLLDTLSKNRLTTNNKDAIYFISFDLIIKDINEYKPSFDQKQPLVFNVSEEISPIKLNLGLLAYDNDCTDRGMLNYIIKILKINNMTVDEFTKKTYSKNSQFQSVDFYFYDSNNFNQITSNSKFKNSNNDSNLFDLKIITDQDQTLLFLYTDKPFDREFVQTIELDIIASDHKQLNLANTATLKVFINIIDINDNEPRFYNQVYKLEFDEDLELNTVLFKLKAFDPDLGPNGDIRYEFGYLNDDIKETFDLNEINGKLTLKKNFNFIKKNQWQLSIRAIDQSIDSARKSSICILNIRINDINNHKPDIELNFFPIPSMIESKYLIKNDNNKKITKQDIVYITKYLPINTTLGYVLIADKDSSLNGIIDNCELNLLTDSRFIIDNSSRLPLILIDLNSIENIDTFLYSTDLELNNELQQTFKTHLNYLNQNSNKNTKNEKIYLIKTRLDFKYELSNSNNTNKKRLLIYQLELKSSDKAIKNKLTSLKQFKLIVNNNLNTNEFEDYEQEIEEDEREKQLNDDDSSNNYDDSIDNEEFNILDSNQTNQIEYLNIKSIYQIDMNENNLSPIQIAKINAHDFDINAQVKYELVSPFEGINMTLVSKKPNFQLIICSIDLLDYLTIEPYSGIILLNKSFDREKCNEYLVYLRVTDLIEKRISTLINLKINVLDLNDNLPKFEQDHYVFYLLENTIANMTKNLIRVIDMDSNFHSSNLTYQIQNVDNPHLNVYFDANDYFQINVDPNAKNSLQLLIKKELDYEKMPKLYFKLHVSDRDYIERSTLISSNECLIEINVLDMNDNKPYVNKIVSLDEAINVTKISNQSSTTKTDYLILINLDRLLLESDRNNQFSIGLFKIDAFDKDLNSKVVYSLENVKYLDLSDINNKNISNNDFYVYESSNSDSKKLKLYKNIYNQKISKESSHLFTLNKTNGLLNLDLNSKTNKREDFYIPIFSLLKIKVSDLAEGSFNTDFNVAIVIMDKTINLNYTSVQNLVRSYHFEELNESDLTTRSSLIYGTSKRTSNSRVSLLKEINNILTGRGGPSRSYQTPIAIVITVVILTLLVFMIISLIYAMKTFKIMKNKLFSSKCNKIKQDHTIPEDGEKENSSLIDENQLLPMEKFVNEQNNNSVNPQNERIVGSRLNKFISNRSMEEDKILSMKSNSLQVELKNESTNENTSNNNQQSLNSNDSSIFSDKSNVEYLYDSPILVRKIYESADVESKIKYAKKYNLEYLLDNDTCCKNDVLSLNKKNSIESKHKAQPFSTILKTNSENSKSSLTQKKKKITFKFNQDSADDKTQSSFTDSFTDDNQASPINITSQANEAKLQSYYYNLLDDDFILPTISNTRNNKNVCTIHGNSIDLTYKKSNYRPENDVWIRKMGDKNNGNNNSNSTSLFLKHSLNMNMNGNINNNEIFL